MFDSSLCERTINKLPVFIPWWQFPWLKNLLPIVLLLLVFLGLGLIYQQARRRRWLRNPKTLFILFFFSASLALIPLLLDQALVVLLPKDSGEVANAIVIIGRGGGDFYKDRVNLATELWQAKRAPLVFTSGIVDAPKLMSQLKEKGIPNSELDGENCSLTTSENAVFSAAILQQRGIKKIILITDAPHMLRSLLVFRANGFTVIPKTTPLPSYLGAKGSTFIKIREYGGLINYAFRGLFFSQRSPELDNPALANAVQQAEKYGKQR